MTQQGGALLRHVVHLSGRICLQVVQHFCLFPDLLLVQNPEEPLGGVKALAVIPSKQKKEAGQWLKLRPKQRLQFRKLFLLYEVKSCDLPSKTEKEVEESF